MIKGVFAQTLVSNYNKKNMLNVIIDSNIVIANYYLKYTAFSKFCKYFPERLIRVYITEVSIEEIFKNYRNNYNEISSEFARVRKKLNRISLTEIEFEDSDLEQTCIKYQNYLYDFLRENDIKILPYPKVEHKEIVQYSILGKKPFKYKDTGYKDFLIWHSALSLMQNSKQPLVVLTKDSDFIEDNKVCNDFIEFLQENNVDPNRLSLLTSVNEFNLKYIDEIVEKVDLRKHLENFENAEEFIEKFKENFESKLEGYSLDNNELLSTEFENPTISYATFSDFDTIDEVEVYDDESFIITITMRLSCEVEFYVFKSDYLVMAEEECTFKVIDMDWNKHYIAAYQNMDLEVEFSIIIDKMLTNIIAIDINEIRNYNC